MQKLSLHKCCSAQSFVIPAHAHCFFFFLGCVNFIFFILSWYIRLDLQSHCMLKSCICLLTGGVRVKVFKVTDFKHVILFVAIGNISGHWTWEFKNRKTVEACENSRKWCWCKWIMMHSRFKGHKAYLFVSSLRSPFPTSYNPLQRSSWL